METGKIKINDVKTSFGKPTAEKSIAVSVLFFGVLREKVGADEVSLAGVRPANVENVKREIFARYPSLDAYAKSVFVAVNLEYASDDREIAAGDEIAFFPPVSGG